jgi:hypothetical protein
MIVLAYLISAPLSTAQEVNTHDSQDRVIFGSRTTDEGDEEYLRWISEILLGLEKGEWAFSSSTDVLYGHQLLSTEGTIDDRMRAFVHRLLRDFHHQWRHILRNNCNTVTLRVLSRAIIRLSMLDFEVHENTGGHGPRGVHVWITQLPAWKPFKADIKNILYFKILVRVGIVWVVSATRNIAGNQHDWESQHDGV